MSSKVLERFIDYTLTGDKNELKKFLESLKKLDPQKIPRGDYCAARGLKTSPDARYCFLGQVMSNQYRAFFTTCSSCPFFFPRELLEDFRRYASGDHGVLPRILAEAERRENIFTSNIYYPNNTRL